MILKFLLVAGVIYFVYILFFKKSKINLKDENTKDISANEMVECSGCGVYVDIDEAILSNGKYYCSSDCIGR